MYQLPIADQSEPKAFADMNRTRHSATFQTLFNLNRNAIAREYLEDVEPRANPVIPVVVAQEGAQRMRPLNCNLRRRRT